MIITCFTTNLFLFAVQFSRLVYPHTDDHRILQVLHMLTWRRLNNGYIYGV
jgi:hypothetical protein